MEEKMEDMEDMEEMEKKWKITCELNWKHKVKFLLVKELLLWNVKEWFFMKSFL